MSWTRLLLVESQTNLLFPNKKDGICKGQQNVQVLCEILLGSLCNRMPQIFPTPRIPSKMLVKGCQVLPSVLFGPKFGVSLWGSGFLRQFPSSSQQRFLNTTTFRRDFIHFLLAKNSLYPRHLPNGCPPNLTPPWRCHVDLFWCPRSVAPFPGSWAKVGRPSAVNLSLPSFDLWIPMALGEGWEASTTILVPWKMNDFLFVFLMAWPMRKGKAATKYEGSVKFCGSMCFLKGCC